MQMNRLFIPILFSVLIFSCKKDTDETPPVIEVSSPVENASYNTFDTIIVKAFITDDRKLKSVTAELLDADLKSVVKPFEKSLDVSEYNMNIGLIIDNIHLISGKYYLLVTASDENNTSKDFTEINVTGLPLLTKGYMVFERQGNEVFMHQYTDGTDSVKWQIPGPFKDALIDNYYQQAGYLQGTAGSFGTLPLIHLINPWQLPPDQGGITFSRSQPDQAGIQIGYKNGDMAIFIEEGNLRKTYKSEQNYFPALSLINNDNVIVWQVQDSQMQNKIEVFFIGGAIRQVSVFNPSVVNMVNKNDDEIYLGSNENGNGQLQSYNLENGLFVSLYDFPGEPIVALCRGRKGTVYLSTAEGIYSYNDQIQNPITPVPLSDLAAVQMDWDYVHEVLVVTTADALYTLDSFGNEIQTYPLTGFPEKLQVWYSK